MGRRVWHGRKALPTVRAAQPPWNPSLCQAAAPASLNPLPSAGRVKTDGCLFNGMHELSEKPNSSPPQPGAHTRLL